MMNIHNKQGKEKPLESFTTVILMLKLQRFKIGRKTNQILSALSHMKTWKYLLLPLCLILLSAGNLNLLNSKVKIIVIDAGHGGHDPGCNGEGSHEKDVTLAVALKLGKMLEDSLKDVKVVFTRKTDVFVELWERSNIANKNNADLFISIHCNANNATTANGTETYVMGLHKTESNLAVSKRENEAVLFEENYKDNKNYEGFDPNSPIGHIIFSMIQNAYLEQSLFLASSIEEEFVANGQMKSRGVKQAGFLVLWKTAMPSVLVETGFLTNSEDRKSLISVSGQDKIAYSLFKAVKRYKQNIERTN